jgi:hypothetical protein
MKKGGELADGASGGKERGHSMAKVCVVQAKQRQVRSSEERAIRRG